MRHWIEKIYLSLFVSSGFEYGDYLKRKKVLYSQGADCFVSKGASIPDPHLVRMGNNVWVTQGCHLLCHDASAIMINVMRRSCLDRVGPITLGNNCFLGNNSLVLPGVAIGSNTVIGAGSVVTRDVPENSVYAGNPAQRIASLAEFIKKLERTTQTYPWANSLVKNRPHVYDLTLERDLKKARAKYFFQEETVS